MLLRTALAFAPSFAQHQRSCVQTPTNREFVRVKATEEPSGKRRSGDG